MSSHSAAVLTAQGSLLSVQGLPTPTPGPGELLVTVKSIALNPIDWYMRDFGFAISSYPAVPGSDIAGTVSSIGSGFPSSSAFKPGTRVVAFAPAYYQKGKPEYGAFQAQVLIPSEFAAVLPDSVSFNDATLLPMAVGTAWSGWTTLGLTFDTKVTAADKKGIVVWGAASSIGLAAVQIAAKTLGYTVYAVASVKHEAYIKSLGAKAVIDYKDAAAAVSQVVSAAKAEGISINLAYHATGDLKPAQEIVAPFGAGGLVTTAVPMDDKTPKTDGVETRFILAPQDLEERAKHMRFIYNTWLQPALESGQFVPAPKPKVVPGGLKGLNNGLDELKAGVSGVKLVVEV